MLTDRISCFSLMGIPPTVEGIVEGAPRTGLLDPPVFGLVFGGLVFGP